MKQLSIAMPALLLAAAALATSPAQAGRDPFARPALPPAAALDAQAATEPAPPPQLRAIMVAPGQALANINGRILAVGEWIGDYRVVRIRERSVTLATRGGAKSELALDQAGNQ
jgi:MSHA biogenesis protein MshK